MSKHKLLSLLVLTGMLAAMFVSTPLRSTAQGSRTFPETGKTVSGRFLEYWNRNGGLAQQGFPISEEMEEQSDTDGQTYTVQYFQRAVFEMHPENAAPYDVLLSLLGANYYAEKYDGNAPGQKAGTTNPRKFADTGKTIQGVFRKYWEEHGGLAQQGFPISEEFQEKSDTDGNTYTVQYFERAVFERHPEYAGTPNEVQLSLLGVSALNTKYAGGTPSDDGPPAPTLSTKIFARPGWTNIAATSNNIVVFHNASNDDFAMARIGDDGSLTPLFDIPGDGPSAVTHVVAGYDKFLYAYQEASGSATILSTADNGILELVMTEQWQPGWSKIAIDKQTGLGMFYNTTTAQYVTTKTNADGTLTNLDSDTTDPDNLRLDHMLPVGNGMWFFLRPGLTGNDTIITGRLLGNGSFTPGKAAEIETLSWTHIVSDNSLMLFYNNTVGIAMTGSVAADGTFSQLKSFTGWNKWEQVVATENQVILFYNASSGALATSRLTGNNGVTNLKRYDP